MMIIDTQSTPTINIHFIFFEKSYEPYLLVQTNQQVILNNNCDQLKMSKKIIRTRREHKKCIK